MVIKKIKQVLLVSVITYVLIEMVCFIFIKTSFKAAHFPSFSFRFHYDKYDFTIAELDSNWGTWHYKETHTEKKQCFESVYHINSYGARDKERIKTGDSNRVIFLGDSFIEGYGLEESQRLSNRLEQLLKKEMLNFGCGYFTPTQEYLVYKHLASGFSHNTIVLGLLPFNDFNEDDTSFHEMDGFIHYQPFFQVKATGYQLMYREKEFSASTFNKQGYAAIQNSGKQKLARFLKEFSFWYNIYRFIRTNKAVMNNTGKPYSGYYDFTRQQLDKFIFILQKLKAEAPGKKIILLTIPVLNDFNRYKENNRLPLPDSLRAVCERENIRYLDLLPALAKRVKDPSLLYFTCDGHWNAYANELAAEIILPLLGE